MSAQGQNGDNNSTDSSAGMVTVTPEPTDDELAAIISAYSQLWPVTPEVAQQSDTRWKFSGRWWMDRSRPLNR